MRSLSHALSTVAEMPWQGETLCPALRALPRSGASGRARQRSHPDNGWLRSAMQKNRAGAIPFATRNRSPFWQQNVNAQSMGPGVISQWYVPTGQTYLNSQFYFYVGTPATPASHAQILADVQLITIKVNGIIVSQITGQQAAFIADFYKNNIIGATGILPLFWERPWFQKTHAQRALAWGMVGQNAFEIDVQLTGGSAITGMTLWHLIDPIASPLGRHVEITAQSETFTGTGQQFIIDLPQNDASQYPDALLAVHIELPTGITKSDISNVIVEADKIQLWNVNPNILELSYLFPTSPRTPQASYLSFDFCERNRVDGQLWDNMNTLKITPTWTAAPGTYNMLIERLTGVPGAPAQPGAAGRGR
jgi:hypothetical protein